METTSAKLIVIQVVYFLTHLFKLFKAETMNYFTLLIFALALSNVFVNFTPLPIQWSAQSWLNLAQMLYIDKFYSLFFVIFWASYSELCEHWKEAGT